ncbi:MAG: GerMN domain-containing protein [Thermodesulfobacteriota bacterium]
MDKTKLIVYAVVCSLLTGIAVYGLMMVVPGKPTLPASRPAREKNRHGKIDVYLYFGLSADTLLVAEKQVINGAADPATFSKNIIDALIAGPVDKNLVRTMPEGTVCRAIYLTEDSTAYVDFSASIRDKLPGGSESELLAIYSIVNSLILNVDQVKKVKILIEGNEVNTMAGHIDLRQPFSANMRMIK